MSTSTVSKNLLRLLRDPESVIDQIEEHISLDEAEFTRSVTLHLRPVAAPGRVLVDLLRPAKGRSIRVDIETAGVRRLGHSEHLQACHDLIVQRCTSFLRRVDVSALPISEQVTVAGELLDAAKDLALLPTLSPAEAKVVMDRWWVDDPFTASTKTLKPLRRYNVLFDVTRMRRLYALCRELSERYLLLVEVNVAAKVQHTITYRYHQRISDSPESRGLLSRTKVLRSAVRRMVGAMPPTLRIHVPLAKRAHHYSLVVEAPDDYFVRRAELRRALAAGETPARRGQTTRAVEAAVRWSSSLGHGRRLMLFVGEGTDFGPRAFAVADLMEMPARSTFREWTASAIQLLLCTGLLVVGLAGGSDSSDTAAVVVAVVSVIFASTRDALPNKSVLGAPVRARIAGLTSPLLAALFAVWLVSLGVKKRPVPDQVPDWLVPRVEWLAGHWVDHGGPVIVALMLVVTLMLSVRAGETLREHARALRGERDHTALYA